MMTGRTLATYLGGASALAIGAAALLMPVEAEANCTAVPGAAANSVTVTCSAGTPDIAPFMTSHPAGIIIIPPAIILASDGSGADTINISGGNILNTLGLLTPEVGGVGGPVLDASPGIIMTLDGADTVNMSGGAIGAPGSTIDIDLGDGLNTFTMSGGTLNGSVFGGIDRDVIEISGTAVITGVTPSSIEAGEGDDEVRILGGTIGLATAPASVYLEEGLNTFTMSGGTLNGSVVGGSDRDVIQVLEAPGQTTVITAGAGDTAIDAGDGDNLIQISGGTISSDLTVATIFLGGGANTVEMSGGTVVGNIVGQGGGNTYEISGGSLQGAIFSGSGNDNVTVSDTAEIIVPSGDAIGLDTGNDQFTMTGGTITGDVSGNAGVDTFDVSGGTITGNLNGNDGADIVGISGGTITGAIRAGTGNDTLAISGGSMLEVDANEDDDQVTISGTASIATFVSGDEGNDTMFMTGGTIGTVLSGDAGNDTIVVSGGTIVTGITGNDGDDNITVSGSASVGAIEGDIGNDTITVSGGAIGDYVSGGDGDDQIAVSGGTIGGNVTGDAGTDSVTVSGGTIAGGIDAETVTLNGGTIGGDITGLGPDTLTINGSSVPLNLRDGVVFSGTNANAFINNEDLAQGGTQVFTGFDNVTADASTLGFGSGAIGIGLLTLQNGSTLFVRGTPTMSGTASVIGSTIQMIDGAADDVFTLGGIALDNATIGLDINQQTLQADQIVTGTFSAAGTNTIIVNLLGAPQFSQTTDIPVIVSGSPVSGDFAVSGLPGTPGSLFTYQLVVGPDGNLYLRATPTGFQVALATQNAIDVATVDTVVNTFYGINNDAIATDLGLASGTPFAQLTDTVTVFASGQFAHMEHDGFDVTTGGITYGGPGFGVDEYSAAISLDFNAGKALDLDPQYGLNIGLFGGYAQADVDVGAFQGFAETGEATNRSGMFGSYGLFRQNYNYLLVSGIAFFGSTDITNDILGTTGDYDTEGYGVTASAGHIFVLGEKLRFDLRGGILGVTFSGGDYTDSGGTQYGKSRISFGALKFEPGIYADYQLENGMTISPYARADIQQRFGYNNEASIDGVDMEFEDADFSAAASGGFNLKMSPRSTLSSEIKGKWSSDSTTVSGKLGLKVAF